MERPQPPPEAVLIRLARDAAGIRVADAAERAGVSVARWSQIESGSEVRHGTVTPVAGRAGTIARMAAEVGVSPERLATEGQRPDAAEILSEIIRQQADSRIAAPEPAPHDGPSGFPPMTPEMLAAAEVHLAAIQARLEAARQAYPGERLTGERVFPRNPRDAKSWDDLAALGWKPESVALGFAVMRADDEASRAGRGNGYAAGLARS